MLISFSSCFHQLRGRNSELVILIRITNDLYASGTIIDSKPEPPPTFTKPRTMSASSGKAQKHIGSYVCNRFNKLDFY